MDEIWTPKHTFLNISRRCWRARAFFFSLVLLKPQFQNVTVHHVLILTWPGEGIIKNKMKGSGSYVVMSRLYAYRARKIFSVILVKVEVNGKF